MKGFKDIMCDFLENKWIQLLLTVVIAIIVSVSAVSYYAGYYVSKIETLDTEIISHNNDIKVLEKSVNFILVKLDVKGINVRAYLNASSERNLSFHETINGLSVISNSKSLEGEKYLMQYQGFTKEQASSVFKNPK